MRPISLIVLFAMAMAVTCMPQPTAENRDIIDTLLPLFGKKQLKSIVTQRTIDFVKRFFEINPKFYDNFKTALSPVGVTLPELENFKWDVAQKDDFDILLGMIGDLTFADVVADSKILQNIGDQIMNDKDLITRLETRFMEAGCTWENDLDIDAIGKALSKQITPILLASFSPIAMQIMFFGKRELVDDKFDMSTILSNNVLVQQWLQQQINSQVATQAVQAIQQYLASNPQIYQYINQQLAQFGIQLPRIDVDWGSLINTVISVAVPSLISLIGKRDISNLANLNLQQIVQQVQQYLASNPQIYQYINQQLAQFGIQLPRIDVDWGSLINTVISVAVPSLISLIGK